jgi:hypothetical protein
LPVPELRPVMAPLNQRPVAPLVPELQAPSDAVPYQPFGMIPKVGVGQSSAPEKASTWSAWLLAVLPALIVAAAVFVVTQGAQFYTAFVQAGLLFVFIVGALALASRYSRDLLDAGHSRPAHPAWTLLTPIAYLIVRAKAVHDETNRGTGPLWLGLVVVAGIVAAGILLPEWTVLLATPGSFL